LGAAARNTAEADLDLRWLDGAKAAQTGVTRCGVVGVDVVAGHRENRIDMASVRTAAKLSGGNSLRFCAGSGDVCGVLGEHGLEAEREEVRVVWMQRNCFLAEWARALTAEGSGAAGCVVL
jgi:hypothetical protein